MRLIDADALIKDLNNWDSHERGIYFGSIELSYIIHAVNKLPTAYDLDELLDQNVGKSYLYDWYINSVTDAEPVWTDQHIEELIKDFILIPRRGEKNDSK